MPLLESWEVRVQHWKARALDARDLPTQVAANTLITAYAALLEQEDAWGTLLWSVATHIETALGLLLCRTCQEQVDKHGPRHAGSTYCESGSIASGGRNAHCSCDVCF